MQRQKGEYCHGLTLVELLMVIAIILLLAGIAYAALAPVREKARQTVCVSNLKQIGAALQMYRADYGGIEAAVGQRRAYTQLGLPLSFFSSLRPYIRSEQIFICPSDTQPPIKPGASRLSYTWNVWREDERIGSYPRFSECVAYRGEDYVVSACIHHRDESIPLGDLASYPVLRLNGQAQVLRVNGSEFYLW